MKKNYLFAAIASGMMLFNACSNDDVIGGGNEAGSDAAQTLVLQVASSGDGLTTRTAGRPLQSSEAKQNIDVVKVIICSGTTVKYAKDVTGWSNAGSTVYGNATSAHGRETTIEIPTASKLAAGTYTVYAFGYNTSSDSNYDLSAITDITDGATSGTFNANTSLSFKTNAGNKIGEEIFAGSIELTVTEGKGFKIPVVLNRQVAGTFGYVTDIPYIKDAAKLRLVASDRNEQLILGSFNSFDLTGNGTGNGANVKYVINGTSTATDKVIYEISLSDWFTSIEDGGNGLIKTAGDNWKVPAAYDGIYFKEGSVFAGQFLIPFAKTAGQTFTLQLTKADGTTVLRSWNVNLPTSDGQTSSHSLLTWNADNSNFDTATDATDTKNIYNVVRNHLYGIGTRTLDSPKDDPSDPDPEPDVDEPESLNNKQELTLRVNDNWEVIHKMELE